MKIGTILKNNWAGKGNPIKYFIYLGTSGDYIKGLYCVDGKQKKYENRDDRGSWV